MNYRMVKCTIVCIKLTFGGVFMLQSYLDKDYKSEKDELRSVDELIEKVIPFYKTFDTQYGWPYQIGAKQDSLSTSTTSMVAFSMGILMGGKIDLAVDEDCENYFKRSVFEEDYSRYNEILSTAKKIVFEDFNSRYCNFQSNTYGINDPLTMTWVKYLADNVKKSVDHKTIEKYNKKCIYRIENVFSTIYSDKEKLVFSEQPDIEKKQSGEIEKTHIFPLLKVVQLYCSVRKNKDSAYKPTEKYINAVRDIFKERLHYHLSLASIENSNFDTAELVFSLEGALLLDHNVDNFEQNLLDRIFQEIKERQEISLYWRPLKPFVSNHQGLALLPLSVEIAMSLIRICRLLGKKGNDLFSKYYDIFSKYTKWLKTRVTTIESPDITDERLYGWCSEHIYKPNVIHPWETSQVVVYLVNYNQMLQKHIANKLLKSSNFFVEYFDKKVYAWNEWMKNEPVSKDKFRIYKDINSKYVSENNNNFSMLLYGPPGTGKTSIAEKIAETKGWPLVTITPSDFIANGADQVEAKAKNIFTVLEEQRKLVVLFDEIDRLILDRDSGYYFEQSDMFQFMTPSMLVKLKNLRKKAGVIFIICTNYEERIDLAIKRPGRIDQKYLVLPPDKERRTSFIKEKLQVDSDVISYIVENTALYTFVDLLQLIKNIKENLKDFTVSSVKELIVDPTISLLSYSNKIGINKSEQKEKNPQKPKKEFLTLVFLKAEANDAEEIFSKNEKILIWDYLQSEYNDEKNFNFIKKQLNDNSMVRQVAKILPKVIPDNNEKSDIKKALLNWCKEMGDQCEE